MLSVLKYGGSSVSDSSKITEIAKYLKNRVENGEKLVVVLSAMGKETDDLIDLAKDICDTPSGREFDQLLSLGEIKSVSLMTLCLNSLGVKAKSLVGDKIGISTYGEFQNSKIRGINTSCILDQLLKNDVLVVAGFQGVNNNNDITTLGRGGSDTTAVALACELGVNCEIYTDVNGIFSTDPRISKYAKKIDSISYEEMCELSSLGANVMHNRSIRLASQFNTPVYVNKSLGTESGTIIFKKSPLERNKITGVSVENNVSHFSISCENKKEVKENIFKTVQSLNYVYDMITQVTINDIAYISFVINANDNLLVMLLQGVSGIKSVSINHYTKISLVGSGMRDSTDIFNKVSEIFYNHNATIYQVTCSDISMSLLTNDDVNVLVDSIMYEFEI